MQSASKFSCVLIFAMLLNIGGGQTSHAGMPLPADLDDLSFIERDMMALAYRRHGLEDWNDLLARLDAIEESAEAEKDVDTVVSARLMKAHVYAGGVTNRIGRSLFWKTRARSTIEYQARKCVPFT